ncbi:hypothetical protein Droror1_Dr00022395 [Drosera rotundifolia]
MTAKFYLRETISHRFCQWQILRMLPKCNHAFHPDCIGGWLVSHSTCPVCRADLTKLALATTVVDADDFELDSIQVEIVGTESTSVVNVKVIGEENEIVNRSDSSGGESVIRLGGVRRAASFPMLSSLRCGYRNSGETSGGGGGECGQNRLPVYKLKVKNKKRISCSFAFLVGFVRRIVLLCLVVSVTSFEDRCRIYRIIDKKKYGINRLFSDIRSRFIDT